MRIVSQSIGIVIMWYPASRTTCFAVSVRVHSHCHTIFSFVALPSSMLQVATEARESTTTGSCLSAASQFREHGKKGTYNLIKPSNLDNKRNRCDEFFLRTNDVIVWTWTAQKLDENWWKQNCVWQFLMEFNTKNRLDCKKYLKEARINFSDSPSQSLLVKRLSCLFFPQIEIMHKIWY